MLVTTPSPYIIIPVVLGNGGAGWTRGGSVEARWRPRSAVSLQFQYSRIGFDLHNKPGHADGGIAGIAGNSPENQAAVYSFVNLPYDLSFYAGLRYVGKLTNQTVGLAGAKTPIPGYTALDVRLGWRPNAHLRTAFTVQNLNDARHAEFGGATLIPRSVYVEATWTF